MATDRDIAAEVRDLVTDLLPVLAPHAMLDADTGLLVLPVGTAHADISLDALTADCASLPPAAWPSRVEAWLAGKAAEVSVALAARDRAGPVEERLRVQLAPRLPDGERERLMCTPYGDLLDAVILLDGERLSRRRARELAIAAPGSRALANTVREELPSFTVADRALPRSGGQLRIVGKSDSPLVTSALLDLGRFLPGPGPYRYGVLVALPRYSRVLLHPVRPDGLLGAGLSGVARAMAEHARGDLRDADDPCADGLYWWGDESLYAVRFSRLTGRPKLPPPLRKLIR